VQQIAWTFAATDHLRERQAEFGRAHGARERDQHLPAGLEVLHVGVRRVDERRAVEVAVVVANEIRDRAHRVLYLRRPGARRKRED
jgi:hypothetical protein